MMCVPRAFIPSTLNAIALIVGFVAAILMARYKPSSRMRADVSVTFGILWCGSAIST